MKQDCTLNQQMPTYIYTTAHTTQNSRKKKHSIQSSNPTNEAICSTKDCYLEASDMLTRNLSARGYPKNMIKSLIDRVAYKNRLALLDTSTPQNNQKKNVIPFITTYNPYNPPIQQILASNKRILRTCGKLKNIQDSKLIVVNRRAMNLQNYLKRSDLNPVQITKGSGPCNTPCKTCRS